MFVPDMSPTTQLKQRVLIALRTSYGSGVKITAGEVAYGLLEPRSEIKEILDELAHETSGIEKLDDGYRIH